MTTFRSPLLAELDRRGLIQACTDPDGLDRILSSGRRVAVYAGFDATADSLHAGHLVSLLGLKVFADHGHRVLPVVGTATALVGDPTGRTRARPSLARDAVMANAEGVARSIMAVLGVEHAPLANDWIEGMSPIELLREAGSALPVARLLSLETMATRLDAGSGLTVLEFLYPLLQAFDFLHLARLCAKDGLPLVQLGGSDQWGNICCGLELIAKREPGLTAFGLTTPLLTRADGTKMGKTAGGAAWLNADRLPDFEFWQFWRDVEDARVPMLARLFDLPPPADDADAATLNACKETIAIRATDLVRGGAGAACAAQARAVFAEGGTDGLPRVTVEPAELADLAAVLVKASLAPSKTRARGLVAQGGVRVNGIKLPPDAAALDPSVFADTRVVRLSAGRKQHVALVLESE